MAASSAACCYVNGQCDLSPASCHMLQAGTVGLGASAGCHCTEQASSLLPEPAGVWGAHDWPGQGTSSEIERGHLASWNTPHPDHRRSLDPLSYSLKAARSLHRTGRDPAASRWGLRPKQWGGKAVCSPWNRPGAMAG